MQRSHVFKAMGSGIIALGLAITPLIKPASAQTNPYPDTNTTSNAARPRVDDRDFNWGWLGLIGLAGLGGLARDNRPDATVYRDPKATR